MWFDSWSDVLRILLVGVPSYIAVVSSSLPGSRVAIASRPVLLLDGRLLPHVLRSSRPAVPEMRRAVRGSGVGDLGEVHLVVLETNGTLHVIQRANAGDGSALVDADGCSTAGAR